MDGGQIQADGNEGKNAAKADPQVIGQWDTLEAEFEGSATHVALLPTNHVFAYGGSSLDREAFDDPPPAEILDLDTMATRQLSMDGVNGDLWCGGHTLLPDGKLLLVGGTSFYPRTPDPFYGGLKEAYIFDPFTESWRRLPDMREGRWYPTLIRLGNDQVLVISGLQFRDPKLETPERSTILAFLQAIIRVKSRIVDNQEVLNAATGRWGMMDERRDFPLYPRLHLLPDGDVFYSGVFNTHYFVPGRYPSARWNAKTDTWTTVGGHHLDKSREEGISILLALRPRQGYRARVLIAGGGDHNWGRALSSLLHNVGREAFSRKLLRTTRVLASAETIDLGDSEPRWQRAPSMHHARIHANGVLLPDGTVAVIGGMSGYGTAEHSRTPANAVLEAELYDPVERRWSRLAAQKRSRVYHSTAILLPDGRVLSMGSNPRARMIERSIEVFSPPYLFQGDRLIVKELPERLGYAEPFTIRVNRARQVGQVVLMRPEVLTHVTNTDQRLLELEFRVVNDTDLEGHGPLNTSHMPRGFVLLFVLDLDGVPSEGRFVRVG